jgi:N-dimethylarginine dimethylaminohydrolase
VLTNVGTIFRAKISAATDHTCHGVLAAWIGDQQYVSYTLDIWQHKLHFVSYLNSIHLIRKSMVENTRFTFAENYQTHYYCKQ